MMSVPSKILVVFFLLLLVSATKTVFAQGDDKEGSVSAIITPHSSDGIFSSTASYTFEVKNGSDTREVGKVSYLVTTEAGKKVKADSVKVNIGRKSSESYNFEIPIDKPGFYKINFMVNVSDYDDTTRKAFGIKPEQIRSQYAKPTDFDAFWQNTRKELDNVPPEFKMTELVDSNKNGHRVFLVEMKSLGGFTIRGYLTEPIVKNKNRKFVVLLGLPGYQVALGPMMGSDPDIAMFTLNIRGSGNSKDVINVRRDSYILLNLEDKNKYILRGAIMDCIRAVDFIYSRPELRHENIIVAGGSLGGYLTVALSSLDKRINFCSAANPILSDVRNMEHEVDWPINDIHKYVNTRPGLTMDKVYNNLDYFDAKNFATNLTCPTLVGLGLVDNIAPPDHVYVLYNNITKVPKHIIIFRDLAHEIGKKYNIYEGRWMRDQFAMF
ncbi:acetylxylan esterase [Mucilaginibacter frigoritolerans]|nr:acetylxylan esterase [Mucilaginibacter frigoritolerans]